MNYTLTSTSTPLLVASEQEEEKVESMRTDREDLTEPKRRHKQKTTDGLVCYWMDAYNTNASGGSHWQRTQDKAHHVEEQKTTVLGAA